MTAVRFGTAPEARGDLRARGYLPVHTPPGSPQRWRLTATAVPRGTAGDLAVAQDRDGYWVQVPYPERPW